MSNRDEGVVPLGRRGPVARSSDSWAALCVATLVWLSSSCGGVTAPIPPNAQRFSPPAIYARWWKMTEACSGRTGAIAAVEWYRTPGAVFEYDGTTAGGYWSATGNLIVLAGGETDDGALVRHEMLHALLRVRGHPRGQFLGACESLVVCQDSCISDAGPWHPPRADFVMVPPDSLEVNSSAELLPQETDGQRWLAQQVSVRNPQRYAVFVAVPPPPGPAQPFTPIGFSYDVYAGRNGNIQGWLYAADPSMLFFEPFETKHWLFEYRIASDVSATHVPPGTLTLRAGYLHLWSPPDTVVVSP